MSSAEGVASSFYGELKRGCRRCVRRGHWPSPVIPKFQVLEDLSDHIHLLDKRNHPHRASAFRALQGIDLVDFLYQPRPVPTRSPVGQLGLQDAGDDVARIGLLALSPRHVAVIPVVADHLLALVGDVAAHRRQPLQRIEHLDLVETLGYLTFWTQLKFRRACPTTGQDRGSHRSHDLSLFVMHFHLSGLLLPSTAGCGPPPKDGRRDL